MKQTKKARKALQAKLKEERRVKHQREAYERKVRKRLAATKTATRRSPVTGFGHRSVGPKKGSSFDQGSTRV